MTASLPNRLFALVALCALISGCAERAAQKSGNHAPVESALTVREKNAHVRPGNGEPEFGDWTLLQAWHEKSRLAQTGHLINPAGISLRIKGRVMSLALARGGKFLVAKTDSHIAIVDADRFTLVREYPFPEEKDGGSMYGLAVSSDGATIYFTGKKRKLYSGTLDDAGKLVMQSNVDLSPDAKTVVNPLGIGLTRDGRLAAVALAVANQVAVVDLAAGKVIARIPVGVCPYGVVVSPDGKTAFVSNFGGRRAGKGDKTELSVGTKVAVDARSVALRGTVSVIDLARKKVVAEIVTGIHPEAMTLSPDGKLLYVVDASGDGIAAIDVARRRIVANFDTKPQADLPYGSLTTGVAVSDDGGTILAANAGNNAVALINAGRPSDPPYGFIPAGGFPGTLAVRGNELFIGNVLGYYGDLQKVTLRATPGELAKLTDVVRQGFHLAEILRAQARAQSGVRAKPVPDNPGEPSLLKHVVYIIKENKKFDQVLGDIGRGNCEPKFCEFPRATTPNTHALADQFVLLDNYYCNGVLSCDGHQWAVQGLTSPMREKDWGNLHISYTFGNDPLCYAGCGFIWDHLLRCGISFRNFGELDSSIVDKRVKWTDNYEVWKSKAGKVAFSSNYQIETLRRYSDLRYPGWAMTIPDQVRADAFLTALAEFEQAGKMPQFLTIYLPNDHTQHAAKGSPTPRAYVADNDLATGRVIEALSKSMFWKDMVVFVNEDDPQTGNDHVDGHRSFCLLAGPYVKRGGTVVSRFYNQDSVLHTICRIFGVRPMNQMVAMAPVMAECFQDTPDATPYACVPASIPIDELNPAAKDAPSKNQAKLAPLTEKLDFSGPDRIDRHAELFSRWVWSTVRGDEPFPEGFMGAHGKGLAALGLRLDPNVVADDDD
jgi:YVTN family beta-propeller protein